MLLEGREVDEDALEFEGRHLIADGFLRSRARASYDSSDLLHDWSHIARDGCEILIDARELRSLTHGVVSP
jgi:hypothetical protein